MNTFTAGGPGDLGWASVDACTLPTAERPLRLAEFDDLFATALRSAEWSEGTRARLVLSGETGLADRVRRLAEAESSCCSFFEFGVLTSEPGLVTLDVGVPPEHAEVLAGLVERARAARGVS